VLALEFSNVGAALSVRARSDGGADTELYRSAETTGLEAWRKADIGLGPLAGEVIQLGLRAEPEPGRPSGQGHVLVRGLSLGSGARRSVTTAIPHPQRPARPFNVVLYVIDTLRADRLGCYGYPRPTSPRIDGLAASGVLFRHAVAQSSFTLPSTASILTGRNPKHHGALAPRHRLQPDVTTLAEALARHGYRTAAFVTNYLASSVFGLDRGFDTFRFYREEGTRRSSVYLPSSALGRRVSRWVERQGEKPFFLYVHATDPHFPYRPPRRTARSFLRPGITYADALAIVDRSRPFFLGNENWGLRPSPVPARDVAVFRDLYDGDVRTADEGVGTLLDVLAHRGLIDETVVILTSDHGEEFLEHGGLAHSQTLYDEVLRVPLLIRLPGGASGGTVVESIAQHVDIVPTILDVLGLPVPAGLDGSSLLAPRSAEEDETYSFLRLGGRELEAMTTGRWKVVHNIAREEGPQYEAYDLVRDPREHGDPAAASRVLIGYAMARLRELGATDHAEGPRVDPEKLRRLQALGYVSD
jgi:arylsulfatase A-like enzyme